MTFREAMRPRAGDWLPYSIFLGCVVVVAMFAGL